MGLSKILASLIKPQQILAAVQYSLAEDVGNGDISAALIPKEQWMTAQVISREAAILCGRPWFDAVYQLLEPEITVNWRAEEGVPIVADQLLVTLSGPARALLTGERTALNWLQTLSGTATTVHAYQQSLANTQTRLLDTRKTLPGLRLAQKYAVRCGGGYNHRLGLYDAYLIKENHLLSAGSIQLAVNHARLQHPDKPIEVEVENLEELQQAIAADVDIVMLDNFDLPLIREAVQINQQRVKLEVSGNVSLENLAGIAATGVDFISVGALTKHVHAIDLSMRFIDDLSWKNQKLKKD